MLVGKDLLVVPNCWSVNICQSGNTFADWTYGDKQGWSTILIPDLLSNDESGIPDQLVCWQYNVVV
jgi:hypothetical protein